MTPLRNVTDADVVLFVDASLSGWGAVLVHAGIVYSTGASWTEDEKSNINVLEALAVGNAAAEFARFLAGNDVHIMMDNTSALSSLKKGSARSGALNSAVAHTLRQLGVAKPRATTVTYIASRQNPADGPSRNKWEVDWTQLAQGLDNARRGGGRAIQTQGYESARSGT